ncbi:MAG: hypothetical protein QT10_C0007G0049 [archaeon GW2011_AR19]|nr:MAG: hypothetical protein QT10_C0007G0049 [archaeon GW2011_AR19]
MTEQKYLKIPFIWSKYKTFSGADFNLLYKNVEGDSKGANITLFENEIDGDSKGANIAWVNLIKGDSKGTNIAGLVNKIDGDSKGANIAGVFNYSKGVKDFLFQYGTLANIIKEENKDAFVLQAGLYNELGDNYFPFIQIYGLKNVPKLIKNAFKKRNLEDKLEGEQK